jgi:hypothetical protein
MAEYSSDEERFSAFVNFFKDNKNTLLIRFFYSCINSHFFNRLQVV